MWLHWPCTLPLSYSNILTHLRNKPFTFFNPGLAKVFFSCSYTSRVAPSQYLYEKAQDDVIDISVPVNQDMINVRTNQCLHVVAIPGLFAKDAGLTCVPKQLVIVKNAYHIPSKNMKQFNIGILVINYSELNCI